MIASLIPSRVKPSREPVATIVSPSRVRGTESSRSSSIETPEAVQRSTISRCQSTENHSTTDVAIVPPTPSVSASTSSDAARMSSIEPKRVASARAAVGPTCRMDRATSTRHSGRSFAVARLVSSLRPFSVRTVRSGSAPSSTCFLVALSVRV